MTSILMVCLGNICRSPVAEGVLRHLSERRNINLRIDSAGTAGYHIGEAPDSRSQKNALKNGVNISNLRARKFSSEDFARFDYIFVMDENNLNDVLRMAKHENERNKVRLLMDLIYPNEMVPVPDPYYGNERDFQEVFELCSKACSKFLDELEIQK